MSQAKQNKKKIYILKNRKIKQIEQIYTIKNERRRGWTNVPFIVQSNV